jgi:Fe2+/Zn2+ uptake regulation proteins
MKESEGYKTKQRELILACIKNWKDNHFTADDIAIKLKETSNPVGKATVYRYLEKLTEQGAVRKYTLEEGESACYQYREEDCPEHFHLKCKSCGILICAKCSFLDGLEKHIFEHHSFTVDSTKTVLYGICGACAASKKTEDKK